VKPDESFQSEIVSNAVKTNSNSSTKPWTASYLCTHLVEQKRLKVFIFISVSLFSIQDSRTLLRLGVLKKTYNFSIISKQFFIGLMLLAVETAKLKE
jgi:hypothetical protein